MIPPVRKTCGAGPQEKDMLRLYACQETGGFFYVPLSFDPEGDII